MGIGGSILLIVIGAILSFGLNNTAHLGPFNLDMIGWIFMIAGLIGLVLTMYFWNMRRRTVVTAAPPPPPVDGTAYPTSADEVVERRTRRY